MPEPPPPFRQKDSSQLELREGGGCMSIFGLPFFLAGVFLLLSGTGLLPTRSAPDQPAWSWTVMVLMGAAFLAVGGTLVFGRRWIVLDPGQGCVIRSQGFLIPMRHEERRLAEFSSVVVSFEAGDSDSSDKYPVRLKSVSGPDFAVTSPIRFEESHAQAHYLANFLRLPFVDASTEHPSGTPLEHPPRPADTRSEVTESSRYARIIISGRRSPIPALASALIPVGILLYLFPALWQFFLRTQTPEAVGFVFLAFLGFGFVFLPLLGIVNSVRSALRSQTVITASADGLEVESQGAWRTRTIHIAAPDILGIDYNTAAASGLPAALHKFIATKGLIVKSTSGLHRFGERLSDDELRYLSSVLRRVLNSHNS